MQLAAIVEQAPSLTKPIPEPLDDLDSLLASPSMWDMDAMLPDQVEKSSDRSETRAQTALASGESNALAAPNEKQVARQHRVGAGEDRKLATSREVQKRFRQRQKARKASIEAELDATKAELHELRFRQQQLESRNVLLERVAEINNADTDILSDQGLVCPSLARKAISGEPVLIITLWDQHHSMTVDAVSQMSTKEFSHLWTAYVHNMGRLLLDNSGRGTDTEQPLIQMLTEAACLHCCISAYNVDTLKAALASRLDTGMPLDRHQLGHAFYSQFLVMADLSEQQIADLLHLRRMCITRRAQLVNCRKAKLSQIPAECFSDIRMPHPAENVVKLQSIGAFVRANGSEDFRVWSATMCACLRGVLTGRQHAMALVHAYPSLLRIDDMLDSLAVQQSEPSQLQLLAVAHTVDTAPHCKDLYAYIDSLSEASIPHYVPFLRRASSGSSGTGSSDGFVLAACSDC